MEALLIFLKPGVDFYRAIRKKDLMVYIYIIYGTILMKNKGKKQKDRTMSWNS